MPSCPGASQPCGQLASQQRWFLASGDDEDDDDDDDGEDDGEDGGDDEDGDEDGDDEENADGDIDANLGSGWQVASQQKLGGDPIKEISDHSHWKTEYDKYHWVLWIRKFRGSGPKVNSVLACG